MKFKSFFRENWKQITLTLLFICIVTYFALRINDIMPSLFSGFDKYTLTYNIEYDMHLVLIITTIINLFIYSLTIIRIFNTENQTGRNNGLIRFISVFVLFLFAYSFAVMIESLFLFFYDNKIMSENNFSIQKIIEDEMPYFDESSFALYFALIDAFLFIILWLRKQERLEIGLYSACEFLIFFVAICLTMPFINSKSGEYAVSLFLLQFSYLAIGWLLVITREKHKRQSTTLPLPD